MTRRIILVRHGRSAHRTAGWLDRLGIEAWLGTYDQTGLAPGEAPPPALRSLAATVGVIAASDLPRARESAALLHRAPRIAESPLLREVPLPIPDLGGLRLPVSAWAMLIGVRWLRSLPHEAADSPARNQGREAALWLGELASEHGSVLAVTHGAFRRYLAAALVERGWTAAPGRRSSRPWSGWELRQ